jgi:hypothetical protein
MFEYAAAHNGIDTLADYAMDIGPDTRKVANPARRHLRSRKAASDDHAGAFHEPAGLYPVGLGRKREKIGHVWEIIASPTPRCRFSRVRASTRSIIPCPMRSARHSSSRTTR